MSVLVVVEHNRGAASGGEALTAARALADQLDTDVAAALIGSGADTAAADLGRMGVAVAHAVRHEILTDYGPEAWGEAIAQLIRTTHPQIVLAVGTDRGNEVMAQAAARLDAPFAANCITITAGDPWLITRAQWGGSLLEDIDLRADVALVTINRHAIEPSEVEEPAAITIEDFRPDLAAELSRTIVTRRIVQSEPGTTLSTAPVVVSGGRGVGSSEGFGQLEQLAGLLGGRVGCSRAATNNGWRPHADQVGQTGTRIAPELYIACGISGAIQHWVGAMTSKQILAINIDPQANMVVKADHAVVADLHQVVPAIIDEVERRTPRGDRREETSEKC